jgi:hypothetical protein
MRHGDTRGREDRLQAGGQGGIGLGSGRRAAPLKGLRQGGMGFGGGGGDERLLREDEGD